MFHFLNLTGDDENNNQVRDLIEQVCNIKHSSVQTRYPFQGIFLYQ